MRRLAFAALVASLLTACSNSSTNGPTGLSTTSNSSTSTSADSAATTSVPTTEPTTTAVPAPRYAATIDALLHLGRPIVLAHTGGEDNFPGSTMYAYGESVKAGVDMLDLNVMQSKDGVLMVQHDNSIDRTTGGTGKVGDLTKDQLQALDNAYWFAADCGDCHDRPGPAYLYRGIRTGAKPPPAGYTADDFTIPTLTQLIERFPDIPLNIEIEGSGAPARAAADALLGVLRQSHRDKSSVVASFQDDIVAYFHGLAPDIEVSPGLAVMTAYVLQRTPIPDGMRILQLPPTFQGIAVITPALVARTIKEGLPIWVWPNDRALENLGAYRTFLGEGIAGLNINLPAQGVQAVKEHSQAAAVPTTASGGCSASHAAIAADTTGLVTLGGDTGPFFQHLPPAYDGTTRLPLVIDLHGWSEPAAFHKVVSRLASYGDAQRFVTITPEIARKVPFWKTTFDGSDVRWIGALLDTAESSLCLDTNRVYVTGFSNGGMLSSTLACVLAGRVAAIAAVAGLRDPTGCAPSRPVPVITFHGTEDPYLAYTGGIGPAARHLATPDGSGTIGSGAALPDDLIAPETNKTMPDIAAAWATRNGCTSDTTDEQVAADVTARHWQCPDNGETVLYTVSGGGHTWPGSPALVSVATLVGRTTMSIDATKLMWQFFLRHPLAAR